MVRGFGFDFGCGSRKVCRRYSFARGHCGVAVHLRNNRRSERRDADQCQPDGRGGRGERVGTVGPGRCGARHPTHVSRAGRDGKFAVAAGERGSGCLPGNAEHDRIVAGVAGAEHHGFCGGAAVFLFDSRAHLQRSGKARHGRSAGPAVADEGEPDAAEDRHECRTIVFWQGACDFWSAHAIPGDRRLAI